MMINDFRLGQEKSMETGPFLDSIFHFSSRFIDALL